ncbi:MAG: sulfurtransferase [Burkholderiales bacterium]|nr:sulfurtransferase [Burkholderiales bacterium]
MIAQVRPSDLNAWLQQQAGATGPAVVLDVREPWELQTAAVTPGEGFELVAIPMNEIPARLSELDMDRPVACLCHHGARSQRVAMFLAQNGFAQVANIAGGIDAWSAERDAAVPRY